MTLNIMNAIQSKQIKKQNTMLKQEHNDNTIIHYDENVKVQVVETKWEISSFSVDWLEGCKSLDEFFKEIDEEK